VSPHDHRGVDLQTAQEVLTDHPYLGGAALCFASLLQPRADQVSCMDCFHPCVVPLIQDMAALAALVGQALAGSELQTARAWSLLTADDLGLRLGLISLEANTFERSLTVWADLGWVVEVFGVAITDTVFRNYQVPDPAMSPDASRGVVAALHMRKVT